MMNRRLIALLLVLLLLLPGCLLKMPSAGTPPAATLPPSPTPVSTSLATSVRTEEAVSTSTEASDIWADVPHTSLGPRYQRHALAASGLVVSQPEIGPGLQFRLTSGPYTLTFADHTLTITPVAEAQAGLDLSPLGWGELALLPHVEQVTSAGTGVIQLTGDAGWAVFRLRLRAPGPPGLFHYRLDLIRHEEPPHGQVEPEWRFVNLATGEGVSGHLTLYAAPAPLAAPILYGYSQNVDGTLLYWLDLSELNPFMQAAHYTPSATPSRRGHTLGHNLSVTDLRALPVGQAVAIYDSYVYLAPGEPDGELAMFRRYLDQASAIYDRIAVPEDPLPDWADLARRTLAALQDPDTWIELDGQRYWRAYVGDTRQSAELISQLDVGLAAARYAARYGEGAELATEISRGLPSFYNPRYKMVQNAGPLSVTGDQRRGDTWYELGHALKLAEWGLVGNETARQLALDSAGAWMDYAHAVEYEFHLFYNFPDPAAPERAWKGTGREPDCAGGYAYYMLLLHELTGEVRYLDEAKAAIEALRGHGFALAYETHITAQAAAAAAWLWQLSGDTTYLDLSYGPVANLMRLSWLYEVDYGPAANARTFFGLMPTQRAAAITPKEQYEAWGYLSEYLRRAHGKLDPAVEKLVAEFCKHTLLTLPYAFPPLLAEGVASAHPAAYETVSRNRLDLYIPLEDLRDGWSVWGAIGQEAYGAGMAPTLAALAYVEVAPGVVVYSGYPLVEVQGTKVTFAGVPGTHTPVVIVGASDVLDTAGNPVDTESCGLGLCFQAEGGQAYYIKE